jgi:hypothetical protein
MATAKTVKPRSTRTRSELSELSATSKRARSSSKPKGKATRKRARSRKATERRPGSTTQARRRKAAGREGGAPRVEFDLEDLEELASKGNSNETIARLLKVDKATLQRRIADTPEVADAIANGRAQVENKLRTVQLETAYAVGLPGSATLQIWLGKQLLGQRDIRAVEVSGRDGGPLELQADLRPVLEEKLARFIKSRGLAPE